MSLSHCLTELFPIYQNKICTIRQLDNHNIIPSYYIEDCRISQLGNVDCHAVLLLVERCVEGQNFWRAVVRQTTGKKPNGLDLSLDCVVREDPPNNVWWWVNGTKLDLAHHRGWLTFTSNKE